MAGKHYTEEEIERALTAVAYEAGSYSHAARILEAQGLRIPKSTLHSWVSTLHKDRYVEIYQRNSGEIRKRALERVDSIAQKHQDKEVELVDAIHVKDLSPKDRANALKNVALAKGIALTHAQKLRGEPDVRVRVDLNAEEILDRIARFNPALVVEGSVDEDDPPALPAVGSD